MPSASAAKRRSWVDALDLEPSVVAIALALAAVSIGFEYASGGVFLTPRNLTNLAVQSSVVGIMATGMVLVIGARHIDLAVGSALGFAGMLAAVAQTQWFWCRDALAAARFGGCLVRRRLGDGNRLLARLLGRLPQSARLRRHAFRIARLPRRRLLADGRGQRSHLSSRVSKC